MGSKRSVRVPRTTDAWLLVLAAAGLAVSAYLLWARAAHAPLYCPLASGCEIVQSSRYAAVFGVPVALLGLLFYAAIFLLAARPMEPPRRFALALPVAAAGVGASIVFTGVQQVSIRAACSLCLISALLTVAILGVLVWRRPARIRWTSGGLSAAALAAAVIFLISGYAASRPLSTEQHYAAGLARHLTESGVKLYGAYWCPHCTDQKALFGRAASLLPYVECDVRSPAGQPGVCAAAGVRAFPTWEINGRRFTGVLSLERLAALTGYPPPPQAP